MLAAYQICIHCSENLRRSKEWWNSHSEIDSCLCNYQDTWANKNKMKPLCLCEDCDYISPIPSHHKEPGDVFYKQINVLHIAEWRVLRGWWRQTNKDYCRSFWVSKYNWVELQCCVEELVHLNHHTHQSPVKTCYFKKICCVLSTLNSEKMNEGWHNWVFYHLFTYSNGIYARVDKPKINLYKVQNWSLGWIISTY